MKHLTILVPEGENNLSSIVGTYKIFSRANDYWKGLGRHPVFRITLAGLSSEVSFHGGLFTARPQQLVSEITHTDLIIIPSLNHNYDQCVQLNQELIDWISARYKEGAAVASICTGAFLLAASGILDGHRCSTHWAAAEHFRQRFPKVDLQPDQLITDEQGIYTNGGAYSFLNLVIYLIEKYYDRTTAIFCAKVFQIEIDRQSQGGFTIFTGQKKHGDDLVIQAQQYIEQHVQDKISVETISAQYPVGRRNFDRRFLKATGNTPAEYTQRVKVEAAKKALETSRKTVSEVMYDVGYADAKAFREVFRKITGMSPVDYRNKFNNGR